MVRPMILLGVNVDHCATLRQARYRTHARTVGGPVEPDAVTLALLCERAGADGITVHLREDRRHVQEEDVRRLRSTISTRLNLEMACTPTMVAFARDVLPDSACLVPESREEVTTEGGLDLIGNADRVRSVVRSLQEEGILVSLFIDPDLGQIEMAAALGAPWIELHTGAYANAYHGPSGPRRAEYERLQAGAERAHSLGLTVNAGHGINYLNVAELRTLPHLHEFNIGHSLISRALFTGIEEAVTEMKRRMNPGS